MPLDARRRALLKAAWLAALPAYAPGAAKDWVHVHAILGPDSERQRAIVDGLRRRFPRVTMGQGHPRFDGGARPAAYIAVGPSALQTGLASGLPAPLISIFTARQSYTWAVVSSRVKASMVTGIYAEPSPDQQMRLVAALFKRPVTVGALISERSQYMVSALATAARRQGLGIETVTAHADSGLSRGLSSLSAAQVVLIFPDADLFTPASLRELLESTYRRRLPVIGFSEGLVNAGTLASAYSDIEDTLTQVQSSVDAIAAGQLPEPQYPRFWRVAINDSVARSLDVVVDDAVRRLGDRP